MDYKQLIGRAVWTLANRRIDNPTCGQSQGFGLVGASHRDESFLVESATVLLKEAHYQAAVSGDAQVYANAAGELANGLQLVSNWADALQTGFATLASDHPLRLQRMEPVRRAGRECADLAGQLMQRATVEAARGYLSQLGTLVTEPTKAKPAIAQDALKPVLPVVLETKEETPAGTPGSASSAESESSETTSESASGDPAQSETLTEASAK